MILYGEENKRRYFWVYICKYVRMRMTRVDEGRIFSETKECGRKSKRKEKEKKKLSKWVVEKWGPIMSHGNSQIK